MTSASAMMTIQQLELLKARLTQTTTMLYQSQNDRASAPTSTLAPSTPCRLRDLTARRRAAADALPPAPYVTTLGLIVSVFSTVDDLPSLSNGCL